MSFAKDCFVHFYGYQNLSEEEKKLKLKNYKGFVLATEIERFTSFFQTDVNVFTFHDKENCYSKQHSYICSSPTKALYTLNVGLLDFPTYQHAIWFENIEKACNCFACHKCQMRVFHSYTAYTAHERHCTGIAKSKQLIASCKDDNIDPYFKRKVLNLYRSNG
jgi:hypothetical protein